MLAAKRGNPSFVALNPSEIPTIMKKLVSPFTFGYFLFATLGLLHSSQAQLTWNDAGPSDNWSTAAANTNWTGGIAWVQNSDAVLNGVGESINATTPNIVNNITFGATGYIITSSGAGNFSLSDDLSSTIEVSNLADTATVNETLANSNNGDSSIIKTGAGTLELIGTAANSFVGGVTISAGVVSVGHEGALGYGPVVNHATLNLNKPSVGYTGLGTAMSGNGITNFTAVGTGTNAATLGGDFSGYTGVLNIGSATTAIGGGRVAINGYDNAATIINVFANAIVSGSNGITKNASIVLNGGDTGESFGQLRLEGDINWAGSVSLAGDMTGVGDGIIGSNSGNATISGVISQSGTRNLSKSGGGNLFLTANNTYSGSTDILGGTLTVSSIGNGGAAAPLGSGTVINLGSLTSGGSLTYTGAGEITTRTINLAGTTGGGAINHTGSGTLTLSSPITSTGVGAKILTLNPVAGAIIELTGANLYANTISVPGNGIVRISSNDALGVGGVVAVNADGRTGISGGRVTGRLELSGGITTTETITISMREVEAMHTPSLSNLSGNNTITSPILGTTGGARVNIESQAGTLTLAGGFSQGDGTTGRMWQLMGAGNGVVSGAVANGTGTVSIQKSGSGSWTLAGTNTNTGFSWLQGGTLKLDYSTNDTSKLPTAALQLAGGTLELSGGTHAEVVGSISLMGANTTITRSSGTATLQMNAVNLFGGAIVFGADSIATTDNLNANGILSWARFGSNNWGANLTNAADGAIVAYAGAFSDVDRLGGIIPDGITNNVRIINAGTTGNITLATVPQTSLNSLLVDASAGLATIEPDVDTDIIMIGDEAGGAIWHTATAGGLTIGATPNDGYLTTGNTANTTAAALSIYNDSTTAAVTINSTISNNGSDVVSINKGGAGLVTLAGTNTFGGNVGVAAGTLHLTGNNSFSGVLTTQSGATAILSGDNFARPASTSGRTFISTGSTLQLQANGSNTISGVSSALSSEQTANQPVTFQNLTTCQLRSDSSVSFSGFNNAGGFNNVSVTFDVNQLTASGSGQVLAVAPNGADFGNTVVINATGGNGYAVALGTIRKVVNASSGMLLNPTTADIHLGGFHNFFAAANTTTAGLTLGGTSHGNQVTGVIANQGTSFAGVASLGTGATNVAKNNESTWLLSGANTYTGTTNVSAGTLKAGSTSAFGNGTLTVSGTGIVDLNGNDLAIGNWGTGASTGLITDNSASAGVTTLSVNAIGASNAAKVADGPNRDIAIRVNNNNAGFATLTNVGNTFSGDLTLTHNTVNGTRIVLYGGPQPNGGVTGSPGAIVSGPYGTGRIIVGEASTDRAGLFVNASNVVLVNEVVANTNLGSDRVGTIRVDGANFRATGTLHANQAPMTFSTNAVGEVIVSGKITGDSGLMLRSHTQGGTYLSVTLANTASTNDYLGDTVINDAAQAGRVYVLQLGANNQIPDGAGKGYVTVNSNGTGVGTLNLMGFDETINGLLGNGVVTSTTSGSTLTVGGDDASSTFSGSVAGLLDLTKIGDGTLTLSGASTHSGNTTVDAGVLELTDTSSFTFTLGANGINNQINGNGTVQLDGSFVIDTTNADTTLTNTWTLVDHATLTETYGATFQVVGFTESTPGVWKKTSGAVAYTFTESTGQVTMSVAATPFQTWAATNGLGSGNNAIIDNPDGDGANNLLEFAFDGNPLSGSSSGQIHELTVDSDADGDTDKELILTIAVRTGAPAFTGTTSKSSTIDGITYTVEGSTDLVDFTTAVQVVPTPITAGLPTLSSGYVYRSFSLSGSNELTDKGFIRAKVSTP